MFNKLKCFIRYNTPRYTYAYDDYRYDKKTHSLMCILKVFADHTFITVSAQEILNDPDYKNFIKPDDLFLIRDKYNQFCLEKERFFIKETLREGTYKIGNSYEEDLYEEDEILDNEHLLENLRPKDIYIIAYQKGVSDGRQINKQIKALIEKENANAKSNSDNVIRLIDEHQKRSSHRD